MAQMVQMTTEQLQQLIESVRATAVNAGSAGGATSAKPKGSFGNCTTRFYGSRDHEQVEEFIASVVTYKEIEEISDEDALKGISLLFAGIASTWWQGVRKEAKTWGDAIALIREHFAPTKPAHQVYLELFDEKQNAHTPIDTFVCMKRALLAQLPDGRHDEQTELDFVYGLLHVKYRKHIARQDISSFRDLLERGRIIEYNTNMEEEEQQKETTTRSSGGKRCTFCNYRGHTYADCRKRSKADKGSDDGN